MGKGNRRKHQLTVQPCFFCPTRGWKVVELKTQQRKIGAVSNPCILSLLPSGKRLHNYGNSPFVIWVCLKMLGIFPTIAIFHRDNDQQNETGFRGLAYFQTHPYVNPPFQWPFCYIRWHVIDAIDVAGVCFPAKALFEHPQGGRDDGSTIGGSVDKKKKTTDGTPCMNSLCWFKYCFDFLSMSISCHLPFFLGDQSGYNLSHTSTLR